MTLLTPLTEGLSWRFQMARRAHQRKRYLRRNFSNSGELWRNCCENAACDQAVCRDGLVVRHPPGRTALARMILEVWCDEVYTRHFYVPRPGDIVIDGGANVGLFSLLIARREPRCRVFAYEPFQENFDLLKANLMQAAASNVTPVWGALCGTSGSAAMTAVGARSQDHRLVEDGAATVADVQTYSFADVLAAAGGSRIALFKCDIEGAEKSLFERASTPALCLVDRFAIEYHDNLTPGTLASLCERLAATHRVEVRPDGAHGYGMLYATRARVVER